MSEFSKRFKYLRESRGMTQDKAAEILGISRSTIAGYESEEKNRIPREETLSKIADLFGTSIDYLLGRDTSEELHKEETEEIKEMNELISFIRTTKEHKNIKLLLEMSKNMRSK